MITLSFMDLQVLKELLTTIDKEFYMICPCNNCSVSQAQYEECFFADVPNCEEKELYLQILDSANRLRKIIDEKEDRDSGLAGSFVAK